MGGLPAGHTKERLSAPERRRPVMIWLDTTLQVARVQYDVSEHQQRNGTWLTVPQAVVLGLELAGAVERARAARPEVGAEVDYVLSR